jgi:aminopeptidase N
VDGDEGGGEVAAEVALRAGRGAGPEPTRMDEDAGRTTRAIRAQAETPAEINEMFDDIAYGKAGAVIGMVENWVGEEVFRAGVQAYLAAHLYGNATAEDFWDAQTRVSGLPVDKVMRSFVEQPGCRW